MKIININGHDEHACGCGDWLNHWKKFSGQPLTYCPVGLCMENDLVGAHVQKDSPDDRNWYIVPLCREHYGKQGGSLLINDRVVLVPANMDTTCGRKPE